ncbi:MAG TPA: ABC transporter substrate-binding protein [Devosia sp.]|jgi:peptide/nickel transport system substrate-binding protein|nr:ABC transporter substrate-binding protein [Devosia sp.]
MVQRRTVLGLMGGLAIAGVSGVSFAAGDATGKKGGTITVAIIGEPPTLDPMLSTADVVSTVTQHFFDTLYTFDSHWNVVPLLASDMPKISDDGKTYVIPLRQGIKFHDGSTMTADDVVACLQRWTKLATRGKGVAAKIDSITATDDHTVTIAMNTPYSPMMSLLAFSNSACMITPKSNLGDQLTAIIGTGPYKLADHKPDQYIQVVRFDDYQSRTEPSDGSFGQRNQYLDEIRFVPVPDTNTRVEGVISGQFAFADSLSNEAYDRLAKSDVSMPVLLNSFGWPVFAMNTKKGLMSKLEIRQAVEAALAPEDMLTAAFGDKKFFTVDGPMYPEGWAWRNDAGVELYNQANPEKAAGLLKQGNYDGSPLRILTSHQYEFHYQMAVVAQAYLQQAGFKVELDVVDWATLTQRRANPDLWDIYISHSPFLPEPALNSTYDANSPVGWNDADKNKVLDQFTTVSDQKQRQALFAQLQKMVFEQVPFYKVGDFNALLGQSKKLSGVPQTPWPFFWNAQVSA